MKTLSPRHSLVAAFVLGVFGLTASLEARTWTSSDGSKKLEAELVSSQGGNLTLKLSNGKTITAPLTAFSKEDQEFVAAQASAPAPEKPGSSPSSPADSEPVAFELWEVHLCCRGCERGISEAVADIEGFDVDFDKNDRGKKIIKVEAPSKAVAQEGLAAIVAAGYYGETTSHEIKVKAPPAGKASGNMTASGVHLCCGSCVDDLEAALKRTEGFESHNAKKGVESFEIKGTASASEILRNVRRAGFNLVLE